MYPERREDTREEEENFYIFKNIYENCFAIWVNAQPSANEGYSTTMPFLDLITLSSSLLALMV